MSSSSDSFSFDNVELAVFSGRLSAICEEMGYVLKRTAISPNIKDRLDYSCAFFDLAGHICAQAAHIPVHLGSMAYAMSSVVNSFEWKEGDVVILNDPFMGGTHLPDVTVISPFNIDGQLIGFFANRAHHANIGSSSPGSMPISSKVSEEGVLIAPCKLYDGGELVQDVQRLISSIQVLEEGDIPGDFLAQVSANNTGIKRLESWLSSANQGAQYLNAGLEAINAYGSRLASIHLSKLPEGAASYCDYLDGDGFGARNIPIKVSLKINGGLIEVDFAGTSEQVVGNLNCPISVSAAAVYYVFICLLPDYTPHCQGVFDKISLTAEKGSLVNASPGAAVAAGNVETSMRIVDVVLGALAKLGVDVPAASQGTMNNVALGSSGSGHWDYYETIGGGMGASVVRDGVSGVQCHLTNTLNTPVESLEMHYPLKISEYGVRYASGGLGVHKGGDGLKRVYEFVEPTSVTVLTERRRVAPWGINGGGSGSLGENRFNDELLNDKQQLNALPGDFLAIYTPGGGAWGECSNKWKKDT